MAVSGYADIAAATFGGNAGRTAPNFRQTSFDTMKQLGMNQYNREALGRQFARTTEDYGRQREDIARALPGQFNRRGMLDSGQYQRGANRAISDNLRNMNRSFEDFNEQIERSYISDDQLMANLSDLKSQMTGQQYQSLVANLVNKRGGVA